MRHLAKVRMDLATLLCRHLHASMFQSPSQLFLSYYSALLGSDGHLGDATRGSPLVTIGPHATRTSSNRSIDEEREKTASIVVNGFKPLGEAGLFKGENDPTEIGEFPPARFA